MPDLSKSKLMAYRQCPKRLWLEIHQPELRDDTAAQPAFAIGHQVGEVARHVFDPNHCGVNVDPNEIGWDEAREETRRLVQAEKGPIFEAYIQTPGALALVDILRPVPSGGETRWEIIEVKASGSVKEPHHDDVAIQAYIARECGLPLHQVAVAHIDSGFVYPGNGQYAGLFRVVDLTEEASSRLEEAQDWIRDATRIAGLDAAPEIEVGPRCGQPYLCPFFAHCHQGHEEPVQPFKMLPRLRQQKKERWLEMGFDSLKSVPDNELSAIQRRIKKAHLSGRAYHDREGIRGQLAGLPYPARFLDFETASFTVPIWAGTRPFQHIPFQYSLHRLDHDGSLGHREFLQLDGSDPRLALAKQLITDCGDTGPVFVYNATFEKRVLRELADAFPDLSAPLHAIKDRIVDLCPIARVHYYHPCQNGSWSLKALIPSIAPELDYNNLHGIHHGGEASAAFPEAIHPDTTPERRQEIDAQLRAYCQLDTLATVRIFEFFNS